ncbi:hypothetical protein TCAL_07538 [Tigriopus californicus]|uniref:Uncharacterized protein n=2 Tax=Tigriopus californicus TaxID=6832 RepID=A0A553NXU1_TIGCA|nr:hypothetical protein TCAL_07538 [Tigriopus californicus]
MALAFPQAQNPYLSIKVNVGGSGYETDVSKQEVHNKLINAQGVKEEYEPFQDHVPPFLALPAITPYDSRDSPSDSYFKPKPQPYRAEARETYTPYQEAIEEPAAPYPLEEDDADDKQEE